MLTIALDAMGGDAAPQVVIHGAELVCERQADVAFLLYGDAQRVEPLLARTSLLGHRSKLCHTPDSVPGDAKPSAALRHGRGSSMRLAIDAVQSGVASAAVSAGNTGALMAMAKFVLKTLSGIDRPAIATVMPTQRGASVALDLGANVECDAENLVQFAVMGEVFARVVLGVEKPTVGLLNIGTEERKGVDRVRNAAAMLRDSDLSIEFRGFVEGTDLAAGAVDVIVTDGFTGNIALKVAEGVASMYTSFLRDAFATSLRTRLGYLLAKPGLGALRRRVDPRRYNGAMLLGLNGVVIKSHGSTDSLAFANAIEVAIDLVRAGANDRIIEELGHVGQTIAPRARMAAS